jgi:preprotein translocase subunit SecG
LILSQYQIFTPQAKITSLNLFEISKQIAKLQVSLFFYKKRMRAFLITILILSWIVFAWSVLMMSPKGWLGLWIGWLSWSHEYWSKKSIEWKLKQVAIISGIIFALTTLFLPYSK